MSTVVMVTRSEAVQVIMVAGLRLTENIYVGAQHKYGQPRYSWTDHIEGAAAELAFAKWADRFWSGNVGNRKASDVGNTEIRQTEYPHGKLILHPEDADEKVFVLLTGAIPQFCLRGWIVGRDGKLQKFWSDPSGKGRPAFFVPQGDLLPMEKLK